ncbi:MAG: hypothetical protein ACAH11_11420 [Sphingomonas sp.]
MRWLLIGIAAFVVAATLVVWPYRLEGVAVRVTANSTGCTVDVRNWSGWTHDAALPIFDTTRLADPVDVHLLVDDCPGVPGGKPASVTLHHAGGVRAGESCGPKGRADFVCQVAVPPALGRYRLTVETAGKPQAVEVEVRREMEWRSATLDGIMSV